MPISGPRLEVPFDLAGILDRGVASKPNEPALVSEESRWTWQDLADSSESLARHLLGLGLEPGDRVASLMPNRAALVIHYLACMKAGLVATPLNYRYMPVEIDHALRLSGASALVAHAERARDLAAAEMVRSLPRGLIAYGDDVDGAQRYEALIERRAPAEKLPSTDPATPAFVFFTSGTTGKPKGVTHSLETMGWLVASMAESMELTPDDVLLPGSSLAHIAAFTTRSPVCVSARASISRAPSTVTTC